jgi:hypothetical protein
MARHVSKVKVKEDLELDGMFIPAGSWLTVASVEDGYFIVILPGRDSGDFPTYASVHDDEVEVPKAIGGRIQ